jgi:hypothetical protein
MAIAGHSGQYGVELLQDVSPVVNSRQKGRGASFHNWESSSSSRPTSKKVPISATYASLPDVPRTRLWPLPATSL